MRIAVKDDIALAITSLGRSKWRSGLTMLGVIIGVLSVILVVAIGEGAKKHVADQIAYLDADSLLIAPGSQKEGGLLFNQTSTSVLQNSDIEVLRKNTTVDRIAPLAEVHADARIDGNDEQVALWATSADFPDLYKKKLQYGNFFGDGGNINGVILGHKAASSLFGQEAPLGRSMSVLGVDFVVFGVLEEESSSLVTGGVDFNTSILLPYDLMIERTKGALYPSQIIVGLESEDDVVPAVTSITKEIAENHGGQQNFRVLTHDDAATATDGMLRSITLAIIVIAIISMLVGGIGIMNVMFVSITERMHEIGLRKAIGATNRQILRQFLIEALVVSFIGGVIGAALALLACVFLNVYVGLDAVINWYVVAMALVVTMVLGVLFGTIPALKAARKDPIEALRHE